MNSSFFAKLFKSNTYRLALTYLLIIMIMSVSFSFVFYHTSSNELSRQLPPRSLYIRFDTPFEFEPTVEKFIKNRINEGRHELVLRLIAINLAMLILGGIVSYYLARKTLEPIELATDKQNQFVSDASHELRTPLTAIKLGSEVALRRPNLTLDEAKQVIEENSADITKLQALTENLLELAGNNQAVELSEINIKKLVAETLNRMQKLAKEKSIKISNKTSNTSVIASHNNLRQILTILLDNAVKYSPEKSVITIYDTAQNRNLFLHVSDNGAGISEDDLVHIFERFFRSDKSRNKTTGGYGLGLAIAKKLSEQMRSELTVTSELNKGSTFTIKMPLSHS